MTINIILSAQIEVNVMYTKKITFGILVHVLVKIVNI